jgi:D-alanine transaminase
VPECATSNLFAVIGGRLVTHPVGPRVLPGVTRGVVIRCAAELGMHVEERAFTEAEALAADELFITSTTREIAWVSTWSGRRIASGGCGDVTSRLHQAFQVTVPKPEMKHEGTTSRSNARTTGAAS